MAVVISHSQLFKRRLLCTAIAASAVAPAVSQEAYPHQEWSCTAVNGEWQCETQSTAPGVYPQAKLAPIQSRKKTQSRLKQVATGPYQQWDWVPKNQLNDPEQCKKGCGGAYVAPAADWPDADKEPDQANIHASADQSSMENNVVTLSGDVMVSQGHRRLSANSATLDRISNQVTAEGEIEVREPDLLIRAESVTMNTASKLGSFQNAQFLQHDSGFRGNASTIERNQENTLDLQQAVVTQCTPDDESWMIRAASIHLDTEEGWGSAKHARLNIKGLPVVYTPYITFPIDDRRKTGFLWPTLSSGSDSGFEFSAPYYLNLAPNYDLTIAPRHIEKRGTMVETEARHLSQFGSWVISGAHLEDELFKSTPSLNDEDVPPREKRWIGNIKHAGSIGVIGTSVDYGKVSDEDFFEDFSNNSLELKRTSHINQSASFSFVGDNWSSSLKAEQKQTVDRDLSKQYKLMPQFELIKQASAGNFETEWLFEAEFTDFQHDQSINDGGSFVTGQRTFAETGVSYPMRWAPGFIVPTAKVRSVNYDMDAIAVGADDSPDTLVPLGSLDMGLIFERDGQFGDSGYTQTLEPRLYYLYSDYEEQSDNPNFDTRQLDFSYSQLFRDTRFSGHDRFDDANQLSLGLTSRFIENNEGREVLSLSLGQIFYFEDRRILLGSSSPEDTQSNSSIAAEIQFQPSDQLWITNTVLWDSRKDIIDEGGISAHYQSDNNSLYNLTYRFRRDGARISGLDTSDLSQADASVVLPVTDRWSFIARYRYDVEQHHSIDDLVGLSYEDCCWAARIIYQRSLDDEFVETDGMGQQNTFVEWDHLFILEFQLKGLGSLGNKARSLLEETILGYEDID